MAFGNPGETNAGSPSAEGSQDEGAQGVTDTSSTVDLIDDVIGESEGSPPAEQQGTETGGEAETELVQPHEEQAAEEQATEGEDEDPTEEELAAAHPKTRQRIEKLLAERSDLRQEVETVKADADEYRRIMSFAGENNLSNDDFQNTLNIAALVQNDPVRALEVVAPIFANLQQRAGAILPEDLQNRVDNGEMSYDAAMEVSRYRAQDVTRQQQSTVEQQRAQQREEQTRNQEFVRNLEDMGNQYHAEQLAKDPDWSLKAPRHAEKVDLKIREHMRSHEGQINEDIVRKIVEDAASEVNTEFAAWRPKPETTNIDPLLHEQSGSSASQQQNVSTLDIIDQIAK